MKKLNMQKNTAPGVLISFCGLDGCGKTTMITRLASDLRQKYDVYLTKQPTDNVRSSAVFRTSLRTQHLCGASGCRARFGQPHVVRSFCLQHLWQKLRFNAPYSLRCTLHHFGTPKAWLHNEDFLIYRQKAVLSSDFLKKTVFFLLFATKNTFFHFFDGFQQPQLHHCRMFRPESSGKTTS